MIDALTGINPSRRPKSINMDNEEVKTQVKLFGSLLATQEEMANWFDCCLSTIEKYMTEKDPDNVTEFLRVYKKSAAESKTSLRRVQMNKALEGDNTLLIWLGKQLLDQKDKSDITSNDKTINMVITPGENNL